MFSFSHSIGNLVDIDVTNTDKDLPPAAFWQEVIVLPVLFTCKTQTISGLKSLKGLCCHIKQNLCGSLKSVFLFWFHYKHTEVFQNNRRTPLLIMEIRSEVNTSTTMLDTHFTILINSLKEIWSGCFGFSCCILFTLKLFRFLYWRPSACL